MIFEGYLLFLDHCAFIGGLPIDRILKIIKIGSLRTQSEGFHIKFPYRIEKLIKSQSGHTEKPFADH